ATGGEQVARKPEKRLKARAAAWTVLKAEPVASRCWAQRLAAWRSHVWPIPAKFTVSPATSGEHPEFARPPGVGGVEAVDLITGSEDDDVQPATGGTGIGHHRGCCLSQAPERTSSVRRSSTSRWT